MLIGIGDGIVKKIINILEPAIKIETFDFDKGLNPDIVGDIRMIDTFVNKSYDCIVCCQVLEHIEYKYFEPILKQLRKICNGKLIISIPRREFKVRIAFRLPKQKKETKLVINFTRFYERHMNFTGEHYWEVGNAEYRKKDILKVISKYYQILNNYQIFENPYHWFIICSNS